MRALSFRGWLLRNTLLSGREESCNEYIFAFEARNLYTVRVAQWIERLISAQEVEGSIPFSHFFFFASYSTVRAQCTLSAIERTIRHLDPRANHREISACGRRICGEYTFAPEYFRSIFVLNAMRRDVARHFTRHRALFSVFVVVLVAAAPMAAAYSEHVQQGLRFRSTAAESATRGCSAELLEHLFSRAAMPPESTVRTAKETMKRKMVSMFIPAAVKPLVCVVCVVLSLFSCLFCLSLCFYRTFWFILVHFVSVWLIMSLLS